MEIVNRMKEPLETVSTVKAPVISADGRSSDREATIQVEHTLDLIINEVPTMRIVCTPDHLIELAIGRMLTEGIIEGLEDIDQLYLCDAGARIRVMLKDRTADFSRRGPLTIPSCCTGNVTLNRFFETQAEPNPVTPIAWAPAWVFELSDAFASGSPLHRATGGAHSFRLRTPEGSLACFEDLGRHNALDKAVGWALLGDVALERSLAFSSGRIPADMVLKAIRARLPLLATKSVPTDAAARIARAFDLTLLCNVREGRIEVFSDPMADKPQS